MTEQDFLQWEAASKDTIDFKMIYVDIAGDVVAGLYLSQCVFWHLPNKQGDTKLRLERDGKMWIARADGEWWPEIRLTAKQARRSREILCENKIMESKIFKFNGTPKCHVRVIMPALMAAINRLLLDKVDLPQRANGLDSRGKSTRPTGHSSFTENTTETTAESDASQAPLAMLPELKRAKEKTKKEVSHETIQIAKPIYDILKESVYKIERSKTLTEKIAKAVSNLGADVVARGTLARIEYMRKAGKDLYFHSFIADFEAIEWQASQYKEPVSGWHSPQPESFDHEVLAEMLRAV